VLAQQREQPHVAGGDARQERRDPGAGGAGAERRGAGLVARFEEAGVGAQITPPVTRRWAGRRWPQSRQAAGRRPRVQLKHSGSGPAAWSQGRSRPQHLLVATGGRQQQRPTAGELSVALAAIGPTRPQMPQGAWRLGAQLPRALNVCHSPSITAAWNASAPTKDLE
jgi:hypothetical protein